MGGAAYAPRTTEACNAGIGAGININAKYQSEETNMVRKTTTKTPTQVTETVKQTKTRKVTASLSLIVLLAALVPKGYL